MLTNNKSRMRVFLLIAMLLIFFSALQSATACGTCDSTCTCTDSSNCPDCGCETCNEIESTEKENSKSISEIFNGSTLSLGDGIHTNFTKVNIDKDITIEGNGVNNSIIFIDSNKVAFNVLDGNTLKLYNLTIFSNYIYSEDEIANFNSLVNLFNGSISGLGTVVFENCKFINNKRNNVFVNVNASSTYITSRPTLTATVTDSNGNNVNGDVVFYINNEFSGRVPIINGLATYSLELANDNYLVHTSYIGDGGDNPELSQNQISFNVAAPISIMPLNVPLPTTGSIYYVAPSPLGNDNNTGLTTAAPKLTILNAYNTAPANSTIILLPGNYTGSGNVGITLTNKANMTIMGWNDTSVFIRPTGVAAGSFMTISPGTAANNRRTINIYNLIVVAGQGTAVVSSGANNNLNFDSVQFVNSTGRSIYANGNSIDVSLNNTIFRNINRTDSGLAVELLGSSTALTHLFVNNTLVENIYSSSNGGVFRNNGGSGTVEVYNSNFTDIWAGNHGGIFCINGPYLIIDKSIFTNCIGYNAGGVTYTHGRSDGGITQNYITNSIFIENRATNGMGGAIYAENPNNAILIENCTFFDNSATSYGGAVAAGGGNITVINSSFRNNLAATHGGAIGTSDSGAVVINVSRSSFENNSATTFGGAVAARTGTININNSNFTGNYVSGSAAYGGALAVTVAGNTQTSTINVYNSALVNNSARNNSATAISFGGAAGINITGTTTQNLNSAINLYNCTINGNWARYGGAFGATGGNIRVFDSRIFNNYALTYGGVAAVSSANANIIINNSNIYNNSAGTFGGAFGATGGTINVTYSEINNNTASGFGGAVGVDGTAGIINILNSLIFDNVAINYGGAIGATGGTVNVRNSTLRRNRASGSTGYGGAIGLTTGNINVYDSRFENNSAVTYGGAVGVPTGGNFYANNSN
ncbi:MAG: hypothetical protein FWH29_07020, partial [Methanobrevibacter sp.]|nr:hypothetical protein [Methanobrevibacter sp.]